MYRINKGIHVDFAHVVSGHSGLCLGPHGHTWFFEVYLEAVELDKEGFVIDFKKLKKSVLEPVHKLLDHSFAIGRKDYERMSTPLDTIGSRMHETREAIHGVKEADEMHERHVAGIDGIKLPEMECFFNHAVKCCVFDFTPTSERLAKWLYDLSTTKLADERVRVAATKIAETIAPVESAAMYYPTPQVPTSIDDIPRIMAHG